MLSNFILELRQALRGLRQRPAFSLLVILTLSLGLGATAVVLDMLNLTLWRPPAGIENTRGLVRIHTRSHMEWVGPYGGVSYPDLVDYRQSARSFDSLVGSFRIDRSLDIGDQTELVEIGLVTEGYFDVLGVRAAVGQLLPASDDTRDVVISHRLWQRLFAADPEVPGRAVRLDGESYTVIGVAGEGFEGTSAGDPYDLWMPLEPQLDAVDLLRQRDRSGMAVLGRLQPDVSIAQAGREIQHLADGLEAEYPHPRRPRQTTVIAAHFMHPLDRQNFLPSLQLLSAGVGLLLLLTCANAANLLLMRGTNRSRELALRTALGASRVRIASAVLIESLVLTASGTLLGLALAYVLRHLVAQQFAVVSALLGDQLRIDGRFLGVLAVCALLCTLLAAIPPILRAWRSDLIPALKDCSDTKSPPAGTKWLGRWAPRVNAGDLLVVAQVTLCMILLASTALLAQSLHRLWNADGGFDAHNVLATQPTFFRNGYPLATTHAHYERLRDETTQLPGVEAAGLALFLPPILVDVTVEVHLPEDPETRYSTRINVVDRAFFDVLKIPLVRGRHFDVRDPQLPSESETRDSGSAGPGTVIISQALADLLWPDQDPLDRILRLPPRQSQDYGPDLRVIGVTANASQDSLRQPNQPVLYLSAQQRFRTGLTLILRSTGDPNQHLPALRDRLRQIDPTLTFQLTRTGAEARREFLILERIRSQCLALFAGFGLLLAVLGTGSVLAYSVSRRIREIGLRMALGADRRDVRWLILRKALWLTVGGILLGTLGAIWSLSAVQSFLFGVDARDPWIFVSVAGLLLLTSVVAAWLPARRAARVDPWVALRQE